MKKKLRARSAKKLKAVKKIRLAKKKLPKAKKPIKLVKKIEPKPVPAPEPEKEFTFPTVVRVKKCELCPTKVPMLISLDLGMKPGLTVCRLCLGDLMKWEMRRRRRRERASKKTQAKSVNPYYPPLALSLIPQIHAG